MGYRARRVSTKPCPQCGATVLTPARFCGECGHTFADSPVGVPRTLDEATTGPAPPRPTAKTQLGHVSLPEKETAPPVENLKTIADPFIEQRALAMQNAVEAEANAGPNKTLLLGGLRAADLPNSSRPTRVADPPALKTMLGIPAVEMAPPAEAPKPAEQLAPVHKTMLGVAMPGIAPTHEPAPPPPRSAGTLMGVAAPTIPRAEPAPVVPPPPPLVVEPLPEAPRRAQKGVPAVMLVGIIVVVLAAIGSIVGLLVLRSGALLAATPQLDENGRESLRIRCETCPDGTAIAFGASQTTTRGGNAVLPLPAPLSIGDNDLDVHVRKPNAKDETVKIHVPVAYRVKADLTTLTASPPAITVRVEAVPGSDVTVAGANVPLDATGRGAHTIAVPEAEGPSDESKVIDKKLPFAIAPKKGKPENGELAVRTTVAPLHLDAPGRELVTTRAQASVAGQIKPGGTITLDGQALPVDAQGRYAVRIELPEGEKTITIVTNAPPLSPRTVRAKITRTTAIDAAAKALDARSPLSFEVFAANPAVHVGKLVVIEGEVVEARNVQGHATMLVADKSCGAACVVRFLHGEDVSATRGDAVRAYGRLVGTVASGGKTVPDVEGTLVIGSKK
jgi:hypothetical protein